ncbi:hypothetical protein FBU59_005664, partial [Linderina macrospora]
RAQKKVTQVSSKPVAASEEIPQLVPISEPATAKKPRIDVKVNADEDSWVVRDKPAKSTPKRKLQEESEFVVKEKVAAKPAKQAKVAKQAEPIKAAAASTNGSASPEKKKLKWALERNSVKRFQKKVPLLAMAEPVVTPPGVKLKSALRKESAYGDAAPEESPLKRVRRTASKSQKGKRGKRMAISH